MAPLDDLFFFLSVAGTSLESLLIYSSSGSKGGTQTDRSTQVEHISQGNPFPEVWCSFNFYCEKNWSFSGLGEGTRDSGSAVNSILAMGTARTDGPARNTAKYIQNRK